MPFKIKTYDKIAQEGLNSFNVDDYEFVDSCNDSDAIVLRSTKINDLELTHSIKAIGRAGAGVNNIPVDKCTEKGIVVFNTPGANANAVKELLFTGMFLSTRDILGGIEYCNSLKNQGAMVEEFVEKNKSRFKGVELKGKTLGVIGLGAIGVMVANDAINFGINVLGYDPYISVRNAWGLNRSVKPEPYVTSLLSKADYISLHMLLNKTTQNFINKETLKQVKKGAVLLNFSRSEIVNVDDILEALDSGILSKYITDFPTEKILGHKGVICFPHLGASTKEAEVNCSVMIAKQIKDFLVNGNIKNSVNFPDCEMDRMGDFRLAITNRNIPNMVGQITSVLANNKLNIVEMLNKSREDYAYTILDVKGTPLEEIVPKIKSIDGVISVRLLT